MNNKKCDELDMAVFLASEKFKELHPENLQPEWLKYCISFSGNKKKNKSWIIRMSVLPKTELDPNRHWEWNNDIPRLVEVDPITGKRSIVICCGPAAETEVLFEVEIDLTKGLTNVLVDTDLNILDQTKYQVHSR